MKGLSIIMISIFIMIFITNFYTDASESSQNFNESRSVRGYDSNKDTMLISDNYQTYSKWEDDTQKACRAQEFHDELSKIYQNAVYFKAASPKLLDDIRKLLIKYRIGLSDEDFIYRDKNKKPDCDRSGSPSPKYVPLKNKLGLYNLSLLKDTQIYASSLIQGYPRRHSIQNLTDGWYNNCRSWIPSKMPAWIEVDLNNQYKISSIVFGSEHDAYYNDRAINRFIVFIKNNNSDDWTEIYKYNGSPVRGTTKFDFSPTLARFMRIEIISSTNNLPRIDELEIYGE